MTLPAIQTLMRVLEILQAEEDNSFDLEIDGPQAYFIPCEKKPLTTYVEKVRSQFTELIVSVNTFRYTNVITVTSAAIVLPYNKQSVIPSIQHAAALLERALTSPGQSTDKEIYHFLKANNLLTIDFTPYWPDEDLNHDR